MSVILAGLREFGHSELWIEEVGMGQVLSPGATCSIQSSLHGVRA